MSNNQQFAIVPVPSHPGHAKDYIQSDSILIGPMSECLEGIRQSISHNALIRRLDEGRKEAARVERQQEENRIRQTLTFCDSVAKLSRRIDAYEAELALRKQREADAAEQKEQEHIQAQLDELPNPDDPQDVPEPDPASKGYPPKGKQVNQPISPSFW